LVEHVLGLGKGRHPAAVTQHRVPAGVIDVQMSAEYIIDVFKSQAGGTKSVEPGLLWKIKRRRMAFVLARARIDENGMLRGANDEGLIGDHHFSRRSIEHEGIEFGEMAAAKLGVIGGKHVLRLAPRSVALDDAGDGYVADAERLHLFSLPLCKLVADR